MQFLPFGEAVVERARHILAQIEELPEYAAASTEPLTHRLRLGVIPSIAPFMLPKLLPGLQKDYPRLSLHVREGLTQVLLAEVRAGRLDAAFIAHVPGMESFDCEEIATDPFLLALPSGHPLSGRTETDLADLANERLLLLDQGHCLREHVMTAIGRDGVVDENDVRASSIMTLVQLVDFGVGITLLPKIAIEAGAVAGTNVRLVPYSGARSSRRLMLVWRAGSLRATDYRALATHLRGYFHPTDQHTA
jgi:LysR family hydrogen peroxide-inducible transcriptional activator